MFSIELKRIFANNLNYQLEINQKTQKEVADLLDVSTSTFGSWCTADKMPRMDKIQMLADYFGIVKSSLIEDKQTSLANLATHYEGTNLTEDFKEEEREELLNYIKFIKSKRQK